MKLKSRKTLIFALIIVVVGVIVVMQLQNGGDDTTKVQAELVLKDYIAEIVTASGRVQPQTMVDITSEVSAEIQSVFVNEGDLVERGALLLQLDTIQAKSDLQQARFSLDEITARSAAAKAQYEKDRKEFNRQKELYEQELTSETDFIDAEFAYENSKANYEAVEAQAKTMHARVEKMEDNLSKTRIVAPMDGVITYLNAEAGEIAQAQTSFTSGKTLMTIADLSVFEIEVDVDETEIARIDVGQRADIRVDAFRDTVFEGSVVEIGNSALVQGEGTENYTTSFRVKVRFDDPNPGLRPGMSASVDITTATQEDAVLVPYAAVVTREVDSDSLESKTEGEDTGDGSLVSSVQAAENDGEGEDQKVTPGRRDREDKIKQTGIFLVRDGVAKFVEIETGIADEQYIVAIGGPQPGDTVISGSFQTLRNLEEGEAVTIDSRSQDKLKAE